jgi:hypothetical protein
MSSAVFMISMYFIALLLAPVAVPEWARVYG